MYNKNQYRKFNDRKILHKIKKQWVTISLALLMMIGSGAVATYVSANADTTANVKPQVTSNAPQFSIKNKIDTKTTTNNIKTSYIKQRGMWDNVNVNYWNNDTMELTGNGSINSNHAPQKLPFNQNNNDWKLSINHNNAHIILNNNNQGQQFESINWENFKSMDLSGLDTSHVTNMTEMFFDDDNLQSLNISGLFNTKNVPYESNNDNSGMARMFDGTKLGKLTLGMNTNLNKANQEFFDDKPVLDAHGNDVERDIFKGIPLSGTFYLCDYPNDEVNINLIDAQTNKVLSTQTYNSFASNNEISIPLIHDNNYHNIMNHEMIPVEYALNIPDGYKELPNNQQDYILHDSHNTNIGDYFNIKLIKDSTVHYQSDLKRDNQLDNQYSIDLNNDINNADKISTIGADTIMNNPSVKQADNYIYDANNIGKPANSYTVSNANRENRLASSAMNNVNFVVSSVDSTQSSIINSEQSSLKSEMDSINGSTSNSSKASSTASSVTPSSTNSNASSRASSKASSTASQSIAPSSKASTKSSQASSNANQSVKPSSKASSKVSSTTSKASQSVTPSSKTSTNSSKASSSVAPSSTNSKTSSKASSNANNSNSASSQSDNQSSAAGQNNSSSSLVPSSEQPSDNTNSTPFVPSFNIPSVPSTSVVMPTQNNTTSMSDNNNNSSVIPSSESQTTNTNDSTKPTVNKHHNTRIARNHHAKRGSIYLFNTDFKGLSKCNRSVVTTRGVRAYKYVRTYKRTRRGHYTRTGHYVAVEYIRPNTKLAVKRVVKFGKITKLQLTNDLLVTSNKHYVAINKIAKHTNKRNAKRAIKGINATRYNRALRKSNYVLRHGRRHATRYTYRIAKKFNRANNSEKKAYRKFARKHINRNRKSVNKAIINLNKLVNALLK